MCMCVGEFGMSAVLGSKWSASKMAVAAAGQSTVPCRVSERRLWAWAMRARTTFDMRVSMSPSHHLRNIHDKVVDVVVFLASV